MGGRGASEAERKSGGREGKGEGGSKIERGWERGKGEGGRVRKGEGV